MKDVYIKVYDSSGEFVGLFTDFIFTSFTSSINGGLGDLEVTIPRKFDDYEDSAIALGNELQIYVAGGHYPNGIVIYSGEIDSINAVVTNSEVVSINCSGYIHQLALDIHEDSGTVYFDYSSTELGAMVTDIIDKYQTNNPVAKVNYDTGTIGNTGKTKSLKVYLDSPLEAIKSVIEMTDGDWYFYIDATNTIYLSEIPTTPTHYFIFQKDVAALEYDRSTRELRNGLLFSNGLTELDTNVVFKMYEDTTSQATYGRKIERKRDERYVETGADELGARFLELNKDPSNIVTARIVGGLYGNGYDIESINVGDTCKILNIGDIPALTDNMLITTVTYAVDYVDITIVDRKKYVERSLQEMRNTYNMFAYSDNLPTAYTS